MFIGFFLYHAQMNVTEKKKRIIKKRKEKYTNENIE